MVPTTATGAFGRAESGRGGDPSRAAAEVESGEGGAKCSKGARRKGRSRAESPERKGRAGLKER